MSSEAEEGEGDAQTATAAGPPPAAPPTPSALEDVIRNWKDPSPEAARLAETLRSLELRMSEVIESAGCRRSPVWRECCGEASAAERGAGGFRAPRARRAGR